MSDFPAHLFSLGGSPEAIAASAQRYERFGQNASHAADRITGMDTGQFVGPEGDQFREKLSSDLPPHLRTTGTAFSQVGQALTAFSSRLSDLQSTMRPLAQRAPELWDQVKASEGRLQRAHDANQAHLAHAPAGQVPSSAAPHSSGADAASAAVSAARAAWQDCVNKANGLRTEMSAAAQECANRIEEAKGMRFQEPPGTLDLIGQGRDFIRENKDALKNISEALKIVSAGLAVVGLALQAIPVVGNAVGGAFLVAAGITGGAALAIDAGIYAATGEGSLTSILVDTALTVIPIGKLAKLGKAAFSMAKDWRFLARPTSHISEPAIHAGSANPAMRRWFLRDQHSWMNGENAINAPRFNASTPGYVENCSNNVATVEHRLNGVEVSTAPLHNPRWPDPAALGNPNARFQDVSSYDDIIKDMHARGAGSRGVVYINRPGNPDLFIKPTAHVFNVHHGPHGVEFLDGQTGNLAELEQNVDRIGYMPYR
ncbi:toxin glutamine deamidase domain-containing protein [Saccharopolyspora sp. SCSIO 74807]|uniref:toxin glutamine deamidase domain-containing protein n=1 Tax=Saccharopolyspora sp. SCSIO 74807 TaxID=3118084 RepID=UPI0030CB6452